MEDHIVIKMRGKEYKMEKGDYILYNKACYQLCAKPPKYWYYKGFDIITHVTLTKKAVSEIPFHQLVRSNISDLVYWKMY